MLNDYEVVNFLVCRNSYLLKIQAKSVFTKDISKEQTGEKNFIKTINLIYNSTKLSLHFLTEIS